MSVTLEIIAASAGDAEAAAAGGADRLELCSALALGGLSPSLGTVRTVKQAVEIPVMCMVRPREGGMAYSSWEFEAMLQDAALFLEAGADGLVFGFLTPDGEVDRVRCRRMLEVVAAHAGGRRIQTVFHRAFDVVRDPVRSLEELIELGIQRILTSGRAPLARDGVAEIRRYVEQAAGKIEILPGGGITSTDVEFIVRSTGVDQIHLYLTEPRQDRSTLANRSISFGAHVPENELQYRQVGAASVRLVRGLLDTLR